MIRIFKASVMAACLQTITMQGQDTQPPTVDCPPGIRISADESCEAVIPNILGGVKASDDVTPKAEIVLSQSPQPGTVVGLGIHPLEVTAMDKAGNIATCVTSFTVADTTPPDIACAVRRPELWPPNHNLIDVGLRVVAADNCDPNPAIRVRVLSDEDDEEPTGDGRHSPDAKGMNSGNLRLRSERKGNADGRVYLIVVTATDASGNVGTCCTSVTVPHSRSRAAINSVRAQAAAAEAACPAPAGFVVVGDGPVLGPKQ